MDTGKLTVLAVNADTRFHIARDAYLEEDIDEYSVRVSFYRNCVRDIEEALFLSNDFLDEKFYFLGVVQVELAELLSGVQRRELLERAIGNLECAVQRNGDEWDYYRLGEAQVSLAEEVFDGARRQALYESAVINLQRSYELDKDPDVRDYLQEVVEDLSLE